jgi:hypothetical protein
MPFSSICFSSTVFGMTRREKMLSVNGRGRRQISSSVSITSCRVSTGLSTMMS